MINLGTYHGLNGIHQRGKLWVFAETSQKGNARSTRSVAAGNSFILDQTVRGEETATFGLLESLRDVVSERPSERKKLTSIDFHLR